MKINKFVRLKNKKKDIYILMKNAQILIPVKKKY